MKTFLKPLSFIKLILLLMIAVLVLMLFSCRSKKLISEKEKTVQIDTVYITETQIDTFYRDRVIEKKMPVYYESVLESPCDSLGNLKSIDTRMGSGGNKAWIYSKNGKLYIGQILDSTRSEWNETYIARWRHDSIDLRKQLLKDFRSVEETKIVVWPWWLWAAVIIGALSVLWNLYQTINPIFKSRN